MKKIKAFEHRNQKDFVYGSFDVYITPYEITIKGKLKKTRSWGLYMTIRGDKN